MVSCLLADFFRLTSVFRRVFFDRNDRILMILYQELQFSNFLLYINDINYSSAPVMRSVEETGYEINICRDPYILTVNNPLLFFH